jgi:hypothetical protein
MLRAFPQATALERSGEVYLIDDRGIEISRVDSWVLRGLVRLDLVSPFFSRYEIATSFRIDIELVL